MIADMLILAKVDLHLALNCAETLKAHPIYVYGQRDEIINNEDESNYRHHQETSDLH